MALVHRGSEQLGLGEVGRRRLEPHEIGIRRVGQATRDRCVDAVAHAEEALGRALARGELAVGVIDIARQERRREGVSASDDERRHVHHVGGESRRNERANELRRRHEDFAAEVAALLLRRELILEVDCSCAGFDEALHQLEGVERAAEAGFRIGDDRGEPLRRVVSFCTGNLVGAEQRIVQPLDEGGPARRRVQALVGIRVAREIRVGRDLPAREVDRL